VGALKSLTTLTPPPKNPQALLYEKKDSLFLAEIIKLSVDYPPKVYLYSRLKFLTN
jgi:hypothetical protein